MASINKCKQCYHNVQSCRLVLLCILQYNKLIERNGNITLFMFYLIVVSVLYLVSLSTVHIMQAGPHRRAPSSEVGSLDLANYNNDITIKKSNTSRVSTGHLSNEADLWESSLRQLRETPTSLTTQNFCPATN